jgi:glucoamylase
MNTDSFIQEAPGAPGIAPTWCSSAKEMVGCALGPSRLWFTIGGGIVNEVFYPRVDTPQIRDLGFIIADDQGFWVELKRLGNHALRLAAPGVPAVHITHHHERFDFTLRITPDPWRDVLLLEILLEGDPGLRPYALLAPHLGGTGQDNDVEVGEYRSRRMLWAEQGPFGLALAAADEHQADAWGRASAGYVGVSDGWQDFTHHDRMQWQLSHWVSPAAKNRQRRSRFLLCCNHSTNPGKSRYMIGRLGMRNAPASPLPIFRHRCASSFSLRRWCCACIKIKSIAVRW